MNNIERPTTTLRVVTIDEPHTGQPKKVVTLGQYDDPALKAIKYEMFFVRVAFGNRRPREFSYLVRQDAEMAFNFALAN